MKRKYLFLILLSFCLSFSFCKRNNSQETVVTEGDFSSSLTAQDTTIVLEKTNLCMEELKNGKLEEALGMIYFLNEDREPVQMSEALYNETLDRFKMFPVLSYKLENFSFDEQTENLVKYSTIFFEKKPDDKMPNTIAVVFNPVKYNGQWYLTLKNKH